MILDAPFSFQNRVFESGCATQRSDMGSRFLPPLVCKVQAGVPAQAAGGKKKKEKKRICKIWTWDLKQKSAVLPPYGGWIYWVSR